MTTLYVFTLNNARVYHFLILSIELVSLHITFLNVYAIYRTQLPRCLEKIIYLTTSTAPALTLGSLPVTDILAVNEPSILNTTHSVFGGTTAMKKSTEV